MKKIIFILISYYLVLSNVNAQVWHSLIGGISGPALCFKVYNNQLIVGGAFLYAGMDTTGGSNAIYSTEISKWNGSNWDSIRNHNYGGAVFAIEVYNDTFYLGGNFHKLGINGYSDLAKITDNGWEAVGNIGSPNSFVQAFKIRDKLYISGDFNSFDYATNYNHIACWDNNSFSKLGNGLQGGFGHAYDIIEYNGQLIVGGSFSYAGDTIAYSIAAWDGQKWFPLDTGILGTVYSLTVDTINNFLYAGGTIDYAGGNGDMTRIYNIARWDGYEWTAVGDDSLGIFFGGITSLEIYHKQLFAAGFSRTGTTIDTVLTKWNYNSWQRIEGPDNTIEALEVYNDELYVGGDFHYVFDSLYNHIASYYETPDTTCDYLQTIIQPKNAVLKISDSTTVHFYNNIIHGGNWFWDFGDGGTDTVRMPVHTYAGPGVYNVFVIVTYQNCTDTAYTTITIIDDTGIKNNSDSLSFLGQNIPNPFDNTTSIPYYLPYGSKGFLQITDTKSELVDEYALQQGKNSLIVYLKNLKAGTYFYTILIDGKAMQTRKMVLK